MEKKKQKKAKDLKKREFSKTLLIQESVLIWITTLSLICLAFYCIQHQYFGELPWIAAMVGFPWGAYGVSQACYYGKSTKENTKGGIKYDSVINSQTPIVPPSSEEQKYQEQINNSNF